MLHSTLAPANSLTCYDVAAGTGSMIMAFIWWPFAFILTVSYWVYVSRHYTGKVSANPGGQGSH